MDLLFITGCAVATIFIIYNVICYKNKKTIYMLNDKYIILNTKYYITQFIFGLSNSFSLLIFYLAWNKISKNPSIFIVLTSTIFWGLNYILTFYARKKGYIGTKEQS
ncbi:MAG: hypothetical protein E7F83_14940 [Clostridium sp.]|jgi:hypothetical protein|uniref:Uncharacterized protein n=1 Tax=Clostridium tertium TaxID=1559 RepID=A0A9X4B295_9CLOT|nr:MULTISPECIES: hypothetical protein [Clostridium]MBS6502601.1 hypothetical protein [Clostridium sp.]MDC4239993.1 hypothetical protein [Clostridium tertium]MDU3548701.1 hypothetical protein [Clostridium sp.]MDU6362254.1 hypothetical protein [Clostridium sp.]MDY4605589.1 hypothetical protein [Clostridium tertium]